MNAQAVLAATLLHTILASVHKRVKEMDALNVHENVVQLGRRLLADCTLVQLGAGIEGRILLEHVKRI